MPDLFKGICLGCGNRHFQQGTSVFFAIGGEVETMMDGRKRLNSERVEKTYRCSNCRVVYIYSSVADGFVRAG